LKCTLEQAEAIVRVAALPEWKVVMGMLGAQGEALTRKLIMKDDVNADIVRGELRSIVQFADAVEGAPALIDSHKQPKK
jgi:hypothetical protein